MAVLSFPPFSLPTKSNSTFPTLKTKPKPKLPYLPFKPSNFTITATTNPLNRTTGTDWINTTDQGLILTSPWEGSIIYKRNASVSHLEYCTTLERLGLGSYSSEVSKTRAGEMGLRVTRDVKEFRDGTVVMVSVDVCRKKGRVRLDGIVRTVLSLACYRCGDPAAECIYSNFSFILNEEPIEIPDKFDMGVIFEEDEPKSYRIGNEGDDDTDVDLDDWLYFPPEQKQIDISKNIRDIVHLEITLNTLCNSECKGLCLNCGVNLNNSSCVCTEEDFRKGNNYGPLGNLKNQMQQK